MKKWFVFIIIFALAAAGCGGGGAESTAAPTQGSTPTTPTEEAQSSAADPTAETAAVETEAAPEEPAGPRPWMLLPLKNVLTDEEFTLADLLGKTIYVDIMTVAAPDNKKQTLAVVEVVEALGTENFAFVSLNLESTFLASRLQRYAETNGATWIFAAFNRDMLVSIRDDLGFAVVTPATTPHFAIRPDGTFTPLRQRPATSENLIAWLTAVSKGEE